MSCSAQSAQRLHADDQADAGQPGDNAEQFSQAQCLVPGDRERQEEGEDRRRRIENGRNARVERTLAPGDHGPGDHAVETGLKQEAPPGRGIPRQHHAAPVHYHKQHQSRNQRARRDQRDRRDGRDAELDEGIRPSPQRCEQHQQRKFERDRRILGTGFFHVIVPLSLRIETKLTRIEA